MSNLHHDRKPRYASAAEWPSTPRIDGDVYNLPPDGMAAIEAEAVERLATLSEAPDSRWHRTPTPLPPIAGGAPADDDDGPDADTVRGWFDAQMARECCWVYPDYTRAVLFPNQRGS